MKAAPRLGAGLDDAATLATRRCERAARSARADGDARAPARRRRASTPWRRAPCAKRQRRASSSAACSARPGCKRARARRRRRGAAQLPQRARALRHRRRARGRHGHRRRLARARAQRRGRHRAPRVAAVRRDPPDRASSSTHGVTPQGGAEAAASRARRAFGAQLPRARLARRAAHRLGRNVHEPRRHSLCAAGDPHGARRCTARAVPRVDLEHILDMLCGHVAGGAARRCPGLNAGRADIIVAGLAVAAEVLARLEARELVVSRYGIREGLLLESARVMPTIADPGEARARSVRRLRRALPRRGAALDARAAARAAAVRRARRAARLRTGGPRRRSPTRRCCTTSGYHISYERHHKHSYHLISHAELLGMSPAEQVVVANVARYHRGARAAPQAPRTSAVLDRRCGGGSAAVGDPARGGRPRPRPRRARWPASRCAGSQRAIRITPVPRNASRSRCDSRCGARAGSRGCSRRSRACRWRSSRRTVASSSTSASRRRRAARRRT